VKAHPKYAGTIPAFDSRSPRWPQAGSVHLYRLEDTLGCHAFPTQPVPFVHWTKHPTRSEARRLGPAHGSAHHVGVQAARVEDARLVCDRHGRYRNSSAPGRRALRDGPWSEVGDRCRSRALRLFRASRSDSIWWWVSSSLSRWPLARANFTSPRESGTSPVSDSPRAPHPKVSSSPSTPFRPSPTGSC